jgi:hypothetical protein
MSVFLSPEFVREVFACCEHQREVLVTLYRAVFPEWENIEKLDGYPKCNRHTALEIGGQFIKFDQKHHPNVMNGGAWMDKGFSSSDAEHLANWEVERCPFTLKREEEVCHA